MTTICESEFEQADPEDPNYSFVEIDYYGGVPFTQQKFTQNHRLTLRKNLVTNEYEVYRVYHFPGVPPEASRRVYTRGEVEVILKGSLDVAVARASQEAANFYKGYEPDEVCDHQFGSRRASTCMVLRRHV